MISFSDQSILYKCYFTRREIKSFDVAIDPSGHQQPVVDLRSPVWKAVIARRQQLAKGLARAYRSDTGLELTRKKLDAILDNFYHAGQRRSPFDWLKLEYKNPGQRVQDMSGSLRTARREALTRTRGLRRLAGITVGRGRR